MNCYICLNTGRPVKFCTGRIQICQWCVTDIIEHYVSPQSIYTRLYQAITSSKEGRLRHGDLSDKHRPIAPALPDPTKILSSCERQIRYEEGLLVGVYRSLIDDSARKKAINIAFETQLEQEQSRYNVSLFAYETALVDFEQKQEAYRNSLPTIIKDAYNDHLGHLLYHRGENPDIQEKVIRAHLYGLITVDGVLESRPSEDVMRPIRQQMMRDDEYRCSLCRRAGREVELHVHHIVPLTKQGTNNPRNLVTLCHTCHNRQHRGICVTRNRPIRRIRHGGEFVAIDIETTGFSHQDDIIELAAARFKAGEVVDWFESLVNTRVYVPMHVTDLTGITNEMLANAPAMDAIFPEFLKFMSSHKLVMHNSAFDMRFLRRHAMVYGHNIGNDTIDTLKLARQKIPHLANHKLATLISHFGLDHGRQHRAISDCIATGRVYISCLKITMRQARNLP